MNSPRHLHRLASGRVSVKSTNRPPVRLTRLITERIMIAGSGGQGIVLLGKLLATAALYRMPYITFFPNYGAEVRGGNSNCQVIFSSSEIASPIASRFDIMILMDQASARQNLSILETGGTAIVNSSLCTHVGRSPSVVLIPATDVADQLGDTRVANIILLGALIARHRLIAGVDVEKAINRMLRGKDEALRNLNIKAFRAGLRL